VNRLNRKEPELKKTSWVLSLVFCFFACGVSEGDFIAGADLDPCLSNIPACNNSAGCTMGESKYIEGDFPGYRNFIVTTPADTTITVKLFLKNRKHPGEDTEIVWWEPGCHDSYVYESLGDDIFSVAGRDQVFTQSKKVKRAGDHLVEIYSDAICHFFVRVAIETPN
jgi:hypothetical protein